MLTQSRRPPGSRGTSSRPVKVEAAVRRPSNVMHGGIARAKMHLPFSLRSSRETRASPWASASRCAVARRLGSRCCSAARHGNFPSARHLAARSSLSPTDLARAWTLSSYHLTLLRRRRRARRGGRARPAAPRSQTPARALLGVRSARSSPDKNFVVASPALAVALLRRGPPSPLCCRQKPREDGAPAATRCGTRRRRAARDAPRAPSTRTWHLGHDRGNPVQWDDGAPPGTAAICPHPLPRGGDGRLAPSPAMSKCAATCGVRGPAAARSARRAPTRRCAVVRRCQARPLRFRRFPSCALTCGRGGRGALVPCARRIRSATAGRSDGAGSAPRRGVCESP